MSQKEIMKVWKVCVWRYDGVSSNSLSTGEVHWRRQDVRVQASASMWGDIYKRLDGGVWSRWVRNLVSPNTRPIFSIPLLCCGMPSCCCGEL